MTEAYYFRQLDKAGQAAYHAMKTGLAALRPAFPVPRLEGRELGSRTFMMDAGRVVLDIGGEERKGLTVDDLLERFRAGAGKNLDNDRILLSND